MFSNSTILLPDCLHAWLWGLKTPLISIIYVLAIVMQWHAQLLSKARLFHKSIITLICIIMAIYTYV